MNYGTHIDFPGHLFSDEITLKKKVGDYPLNRFITEAIVMDVRDKLNNINPLIDRGGYINLEKLGYGEEVAKNFFLIIESMEISLSEFQTQVKDKDIGGKAILFCTGLDKYWQYGQFEPCRYAYFFNPYISAELARFLVKEKVSLIGIDTLQIESPLINFGGSEPFSLLSEKNHQRKIRRNTSELYSSDILRK
jgi:kynurenine formamidase